MRGPEFNFFNRLKSTFPKWHWQRIETTTDRGIPDVHVCTDRGFEFWLELKAPRHKKWTTPTVIRKEQFAWCQTRALKGGKVFLLSEYTGMSLLWAFSEKHEYHPVSGGVALCTMKAIRLGPLSDLGHVIKYFNQP